MSLPENPSGTARILDWKPIPAYESGFDRVELALVDANSDKEAHWVIDPWDPRCPSPQPGQVIRLMFDDAAGTRVAQSFSVRRVDGAPVEGGGNHPLLTIAPVGVTQLYTPPVQDPFDMGSFVREAGRMAQEHRDETVAKLDRADEVRAARRAWWRRQHSVTTLRNVQQAYMAVEAIDCSEEPPYDSQVRLSVADAMAALNQLRIDLVRADRRQSLEQVRKSARDREREIAELDSEDEKLLRASRVDGQ